MELYREDRELVRERRPTWEGYVLSGWWRRVGAYLIDGFVVGGVTVLLVMLFAFSFDFDFGTTFFEWWGVQGLAALSALAYYPLLMRATNGRTLGKLATGIRVVQNRAIHDMLATRVVRADIPRK